MFIKPQQLKKTQIALKAVKKGKGRVEARFWYTKAPKSQNEEPVLLVKTSKEDPKGAKAMKEGNAVFKDIGQKMPSARGIVTVNPNGDLLFKTNKKLPGFKKSLKILSKAYKLSILNNAHVVGLNDTGH